MWLRFAHRLPCCSFVARVALHSAAQARPRMMSHIEMFHGHGLVVHIEVQRTSVVLIPATVIVAIVITWDISEWRKLVANSRVEDGLDDKVGLEVTVSVVKEVVGVVVVVVWWGPLRGREASQYRRRRRQWCSSVHPARVETRGNGRQGRTKRAITRRHALKVSEGAVGILVNLELGVKHGQLRFWESRGRRR